MATVRTDNSMGWILYYTTLWVFSTRSALGNRKHKGYISSLLAVSWLRRLVADLSPRRAGFYSRSVDVGFVVDKFALGKVPLRVLLFYPNDIIPRMLHKTFSCSSYQKVEGAKPGNLPKSNVISEIGEQWLEKYVRFTGLRVVSWFRRLVSGLSPWRTDFEPVPILVGFEVDKVALRHGFSE